jgi:hypothetical protein
MVILTAGIALAQYRRSFNPDRSQLGPGNLIQIEGGAVVNEDTVRTARETVSHSTGFREWTNAPGFERDVFTFARMIFQSDSSARSARSYRGFGRRLGWWVDYPDADLNFSWRLQELTSIRTDPDGRVLRLTDPALTNYPLLYMEHAGYMELNSDEVTALRKYLTGGGALFVNDFWSAEEWDGFAHQIQRVLPGSSWIELDSTHPVFHCVFDLQGPIYRFRVPSMQFWNPAFDPADPESPPHRVFRGEGSEHMSVRAVLDENSHIVILAIHNSDVSDGWEREGENDFYFNRFSESIAYPLGINIIFYFMTH